MEQVRRFDNIDESEWLTVPFSQTTEGFLKGRAIVTSCGVFSYRKADGGMQRELRLPSEVFSYATLESLKLKPVTLNHPTELVTKDNAKELQVGSLGDNPGYTTQQWDYEGKRVDFEKMTDGMNVAVDMIITEKEAIDAVLNGKNGLSMGYTCDVEVLDEPGVWCGVEYDAIQRNIRYNHCAIVDAGRAGDNVKIELRQDSLDAVLENISTGGIPMLKKVKLDGMEYEAEESVIKALSTATARADEAEKALEQLKKDSAEKISVLEAERDTQKERADKLDGENKELKETALSQEKINEAVKARIELVRNAEKAGVEVKGDEKDADIKKALVLKSFPAANFDGKDEAYLNARYDAAVELLAEKNDNENRKVLGGEGGEMKADNADDARERMIARMKGQEAGK